MDGIGIYGQVLHYSLLIALTGSALLVVIYYWGKGLLSFGEEASIKMAKQDDMEE